MVTSSNVKTLIPLITPFTITDANFNSLYTIALAKYTQIGGGECSANVQDEILTYVYAHYLSGGAGQTGLASESIGKYSYRNFDTKGYTTGSKWLDMAFMAIKQCHDGKVMSAEDFSPGIDHYDVTSSGKLNLDQEEIVGNVLDDSEESGENALYSWLS